MTRPPIRNIEMLLLLALFACSSPAWASCWDGFGSGISSDPTFSISGTNGSFVSISPGNCEATLAFGDTLIITFVTSEETNSGLSSAGGGVFNIQRLPPFDPTTTHAYSVSPNPPGSFGPTFIIFAIGNPFGFNPSHFRYTLDMVALDMKVPDLRLIGLEVIQVIQDWHNSVTLVEGKKTFVRAHFESNESLSFVPQLRARRGGADLPSSPLPPSNKRNSFKGVANAQATRGNLNISPYFEIPAGWTSGTVELIVETDVPEMVCSWPVQGDCITTVTFEPVEKLEVKFVRVSFDQAGETIVPEYPLMADLADRLISAFPVSRLDMQVDLLKWNGSVPPDTKEVRDRLEWYRFWDGCLDVAGCNRLYYGAILIDGIAGIAKLPGSYAAGYVPPSALAEGRHTHSHEIGHNLGREHITNASFGTIGGNPVGACCSVSDPTAPAFPTFEQVGAPNRPCDFNDDGMTDLTALAGGLRPAIGDLDQGDNNKIYGFDSDLRRVVDPTTFFAMMSYCSKAPIDFWPSKFNYEAIRQEINSRFGSAGSAPGGSPQDYLGIRGSHDATTGEVELFPLGRLPGLLMSPQNPPPGNFTLVLKDGVGAVIDTLSFEPIPYVARGGFVDGGSFILFVPVDPSIRALDIEIDGQVEASMAASLNAPSITVISPNGGENFSDEDVIITWDGNDIDGDPLIYVVQFSADNGTTWNTLVTDWTDESLTVERSELAKTTEGVIRVQVSDGFDTATDESDGLFSVANNAPVVFISSPRINPTFTGDQLIFLEAIGLDREDGRLPDNSLAWESSLNGPLGAGNNLSIPASTLMPGVHTLSVTATDSDGETGGASTRVYVGFEGLFFVDGFESGGIAGWSSSVP